MTKHILIAMAVATCSVFGQEAQPAPADASKAQPVANKCENSCACASKKANKHRRGHRNPQHQINPGMMILGQQAIMEKYDSDKDGKLAEAEMTALKDDLKKKHEARKNDFMKKYDKDADGKLSDDEKKVMHEEWTKEHPRAAKRMQRDKGPKHGCQQGPRGPQKGECPMMGGPKGPKHGCQQGPRGPQKGECPMMGGPKGPKHGCQQGPRGPRHHRQGPRPHVMNPAQTPMMMAGMMLLSEKYDADKDGMLNEAEMKQLNADADKVWEAQKAERKAAREAKKAQKAAEQKPTEPAKA